MESSVRFPIFGSSTYSRLSPWNVLSTKATVGGIPQTPRPFPWLLSSVADVSFLTKDLYSGTIPVGDGLSPGGIPLPSLRELRGGPCRFSLVPFEKTDRSATLEWGPAVAPFHQLLYGLPLSSSSLEGARSGAASLISSSYYPLFVVFLSSLNPLFFTTLTQTLSSRSFPLLMFGADF